MLKSERRNCSKQELKDKNMLIKSLHIKGMLSFQDMSIDMRPLNVLIGPNASGKSNLIEIIAMLQSLPRDLAGFIRQSGGISNWIWKGDRENGILPSNGRIEAVLKPTPISTLQRYALEIDGRGLDAHINIVQETLEDEPDCTGRHRWQSYIQMHWGSGTLRGKHKSGEWRTQHIKIDEIPHGQSVLREITEPSLYLEIYLVRQELEAVRFYRDWSIGRSSGVRKPQPADAPNDFLNENFSNLALVINQLQRGPAIREIEENLQEFHELYEQIGVSVEADGAQLWLREKGLQDVIPATRLSDGTLRYLALLTILCHPTPPPLICIEEPELGLHPDMIPQIGKLLLSASERTQLIVTTHSKALIDRLWEDPESVIVCERDFDAGSEFKRLSADKLEKWLERYELGELWEKGVLGGNRW